MKTDRGLGLEVHKHLVGLGVETPMVNNRASNVEKKMVIVSAMNDIMGALGLDLFDDSLVGTPRRVADMYVDEVFSGLDYSNFPKATTVQNKMKYDEMIIINDAQVSSNCEHHFVIIDGMAKVAYIPKDKVLGLSKINRVVEFFSKRPQIQERLTEQIYFALAYILETDDIAVEITAVHFCVKARGVRDASSFTTTRKLGGVFRTEPEVRNEFLNTKK
jgi:GTP cyclohydrolase IA